MSVGAPCRPGTPVDEPILLLSPRLLPYLTDRDILFLLVSPLFFLLFFSFVVLPVRSRSFSTTTTPESSYIPISPTPDMGHLSFYLDVLLRLYYYYLRCLLSVYLLLFRFRSLHFYFSCSDFSTFRTLEIRFPLIVFDPFVLLLPSASSCRDSSSLRNNFSPSAISPSSFFFLSFSTSLLVAFILSLLSVSPFCILPELDLSIHITNPFSGVQLFCASPRPSLQTTVDHSGLCMDWYSPA